jgi:HAD superfamily hydrolase (TIGR01459 family)
MDYIPSFTSLLPHYDGFLIDLWGVVHDGTALYDGVEASLRAIQDTGKRAVMLTNAPRRVSRSAANMRMLGIEDNAYHAMVTSGEVTFHHIATHHAGAPFYFLGDEDDADLLEGMPATRVHQLQEATFVLNVGHYYPFQPLAELHSELHAMHALALPMICANPDREVVKMDGTVWPCAGEIAEYYEAIGGHVTYIGKPYPQVYHAAIRALDVSIGARLLAIGDNLATDIRGAGNMGLDSLLITSGVLRRHTHDAIVKMAIAQGDIPSFYAAGFGS